MAESSSTEGQIQPATENGDGQQAGTEEELPEHIKAILSKERQARRDAERTAKQNSEAAKRLAEIEERNKSEADRIAEAQVRAVAAELQLKRYEVASAKSLPASAAPFLYGDDESEIEASAEALIKFATDYAKTTQGPAVPDLKQGQRGAAPAAGGDPNDIFRRAVAARRGF